MGRTKHSLKSRYTHLTKARQVRMQMNAARSTSTQSNTIQTNTEADVCTFTKKLRQCKTQFLQAEESNATGSTDSANFKTQSCRIIVDCDLLLAFINKFPCPECNSDVVATVDKKKWKGFSSVIQVWCHSCKKIVNSMDTSAKESRKGPSTINKDIVLASLALDMGPYKMNKFAEYVNLHGMHQKTFQAITKNLHKEMVCTENEVYKKAAAIVRNTHRAETSEILDIAVSFDGTWLTRGHSSLIGIGTVIEIQTGLVLDMHVTSLHCSICAQKNKLKSEDPPAYKKWLEIHQSEGGCTINHVGPSGMMEAKAAEVLWSRSLQLHNMQYTVMLGDGDSKAFDRVTGIEPYGSLVKITKEECVNHISKRLGSALRNLVQDCSKQRVTLGGRKVGSLTAEKIRKLSIYYSRAVRGNKTAEDMRKAILASLHHNYSTDEYPQHQFCPPGADSWCFYKRDVAEHKYPGGHAKRIHSFLDFNRLHKYMWPVYERLSDVALLKRCELRSTQNANESLHNCIWARCSKVNFHSAKRVQYAAISAIAEFNFGPMHAMTLLGKIGNHSRRLSEGRQKRRLDNSLTTVLGKSKERQKKRKLAAEQAQKDYIQQHGISGYECGQF